MNRKPLVQMSDDIVEALRLFAIWLERGVHPEGFDFKAWIRAYGPRMLVLEALKLIKMQQDYIENMNKVVETLEMED